jgi:hypothetical protein
MFGADPKITRNPLSITFNHSSNPATGLPRLGLLLPFLNRHLTPPLLQAYYVSISKGKSNRPSHNPVRVMLRKVKCYGTKK